MNETEMHILFKTEVAPNQGLLAEEGERPWNKLNL